MPQKYQSDYLRIAFFRTIGSIILCVLLSQFESAILRNLVIIWFSWIGMYSLVRVNKFRYATFFATLHLISLGYLVAGMLNHYFNM